MVPQNKEREEQWITKYGQDAVGNCKRALDELKEFTKNIKTLKKLNEKLDEITHTSLIEAQHNDMIKISNNCKFDKEKDRIWFKNQYAIRLLQSKIFKEKYTELKLSNKSINQTINDNINNQIFKEDGTAVANLFSFTYTTLTDAVKAVTDAFNVNSYFKNIYNIIFPDEESGDEEDKKWRDEAWVYSDTKIDEYIDNIKSSDLTDQEKRDLSTQSMNHRCNKCQCEPESDQERKPAHETYTECLGSIWSDHHEKILTEIINELTKLI